MPITGNRGGRVAPSPQQWASICAVIGQAPVIAGGYPRKSPRLDQYRNPRYRGQLIGCCVGEAVAAMGETTLRTPEPFKEGVPAGPAVDLSPLWCYWAARDYSARNGRPLYGEGAIVTDALAAVVERGYRRFEAWPANEQTYGDYDDRRPMPGAVSAPPVKVRGEARRLVSPDQILEYLGNGYSVVWGGPWRGGSATRPDGSFAWSGWSMGGHAVELLGYDLDKNQVVIGNSWQNAGWGVNPGCYGITRWTSFARDCTEAKLTSGEVEAVVITELDGPTPTPGPTPPPKPGQSYPIEIVLDGRTFRGVVSEDS